jgi:hypothetical protein
MITDKPSIKNLVGTKGVEIDKDLEEEFKTTLAATLSQPKEKYPEPMTSNQEIGWDWNEVHELAVTATE